MPPKRAPKAPPAPARSPAKKAPRPAATKKKESQPKAQKPKRVSKEVAQQLVDLLRDPSASARSIVDFVVGPTCGLESLHNQKFQYFSNATPFLLAVEANRLDVAQLLVAEHSANTKAVADMNFTALYIASGEGNLEMVRWLVERCGIDVQAVSVYGNSPLHFAISCRHSDVALLLLELGADPNHSNAKKSTPLHVACEQGLVDVARALIAKGASRNVADAEGKTPLDLAVEGKHSEIVALLGARP